MLGFYRAFSKEDRMNAPGLFYISALNLIFFFTSIVCTAQTDATLKSGIDATQVTVGDQVKLFIELSHNTKQSRVQWAIIPDTFNSLEIIEKGKIDTIAKGDNITYKQRLLVAGFDSGSFKIPAFVFPVMPANGTAYTLQTDSFQLHVTTVPVDTTKPFRPIKDIIAVKATWRDYIWLIIGGLVFLALMAFVIYYFIRNKKTPIPAIAPRGPQETLQEKTLRLLVELEDQKLWQAGKIKEYYTALTDILRNYIEERFHTPARELTTDEILAKAREHPELRRHYDQLSNVLYTADLAKFAKAQPLPHEHTTAMDYAKQFIISTIPEPIETQQKLS
jgi:hypothetical protein